MTFGQYLGIPKHISEEKANAALTLLKFLTSREFQKKVVLEYDHIYYSAVPSLYDDEEICSVVDCNLMKNLQPVLMPFKDDYDTFSKGIRKSIYDYLYNSESVDKVINDLSLYSGATTLKKITYSLVTMMAASILLLL